MLIQGGEEIISLLCKGAGHKKRWPWVIVGQIMGTLLYRALYFMTKQPYFVSGTAFTLVAISWPENLKSLLEEPHHLFTREADRMCRGEDAYSGNEEATSQVYVYSVPTQGLPHSLGRVPVWGTTAVTEEIKDNQTPWFLWTDCVAQPSLTCQGLPPLLLGASHYQWCQIGVAAIQVQTCWHFPASEQEDSYSQLLCLATFLSMTSKEQELSNILDIAGSQLHVKSLNTQQHIDSCCWVLDIILQLKLK